MNKTAIKHFAIWARNKLIADIIYKAGLLGITEKEIKNPLPQSTQTVQFFDIGTKEPNSITGTEIEQRKKLVEEIQRKSSQVDYNTAYKNVIEEVAYTWFNRLIAIRFMEVNDYLPTRVRVLSSESKGKSEPDIVTHALDVDLEYSAYEKDQVMKLKQENKLDELFRMLFIKQCNALNANLPNLFEKTSDYTELLLNVSFTDKDGVVYRLVNDIPEDDFNVSKEGQVEIIGWLYQYYNTEINELVYDGSMAKTRISKELLPAATTIYTPDWAIRYMIENSLGRFWLKGHPNEDMCAGWKYYIDDVEQDRKVHEQLSDIYKRSKVINPEEIKLIDPCMGSGHILVYAFDILMQVYECCGYSKRDAAKKIIEKNIYGLDIDKRAYQLAYFAIMMKARQYNRQIFTSKISCNVYEIIESNTIDRNQLKFFGSAMNERMRKNALSQMEYLIDQMYDAKEYGSILKIEKLDWVLLNDFLNSINISGQITIDTINIDMTRKQLIKLVQVASVLAGKFDVIVTNPPYFSSLRFSTKLLEYVNNHYSSVKSDLSMIMYKKAIDDFSKENSYISFITTSSWMYLKSFESLREYILNNIDFVSIVDFGTELFEGKVGHNPIVAWVNHTCHTNRKIVGIRLVDYCYSRRGEKEGEFFEAKNRYYPHQDNLLKIPSMPIAYWVSEKFVSNFEKGLRIDGISDFTGSQNITANNEKFIRYIWEISNKHIGENKNWSFYAKGGDFRKWYGNIELVVDTSSAAINFYKNNSTSNYLNEKYWYREGITYSAVTTKGTGFRYYPPIGGFDKGGPTICYIKDLYYVLGLFNTKVAGMILNMMNPTINLQVKDIKALPIIFDYEKKDIIEKLVKENISYVKLDWDSFETSADFKIHPLIMNKEILSEVFIDWQQFAKSRFNRLKENEEELNRIFIDIYGLSDELTPEVKEKDVSIRKANIGRDIRSFISYAVGCMIGRYSLDVEGLAYAGGDWDNSKYSTFIPDKENIIPITDEEYFKDDIVGLFVAFVKKVYGEDTIEENLDFIAEALGNKGNISREVIRNYFIKDFFKDHCKIYKKRPIYWLFDSGKHNGFKALIYMHRYDENTIGNLRIDYLHKMQRIYENEITRMQETIENSNNAREVTAATKRKEKLIKQLKETKEYDEKIAHLALARTPIDLDDGVKVNYEKVQMDTEGKKLDVLAKI
ncbi:hypothetical protein GGQ84_000543 [Desulfitispora alkaliphila]|uniref:BREX-1 system adenine-specific DNA-methyltransferase PglX n=1 Tax=Desulfitispora alkaliphila TaxID=622674 RepID=UPI003D1A9F6E